MKNIPPHDSPGAPFADESGKLFPAPGTQHFAPQKFQEQSPEWESEPAHFLSSEEMSCQINFSMPPDEYAPEVDLPQIGPSESWYEMKLHRREGEKFTFRLVEVFLRTGRLDNLECYRGEVTVEPHDDGQYGGVSLSFSTFVPLRS